MSKSPKHNLAEKRHKKNLKRKNKKLTERNKIVRQQMNKKPSAVQRALNEIKKSNGEIVVESTFKNEQEAINESKHMLNNIYPLFSYLTFVHYLLEQKAIPATYELDEVVKNTLPLDLVREYKVIKSLEKRIKNFSYLENELLQVEMLEFGEDMMNLSERIETAINNLTPFANHINMLLEKCYDLLPDEDKLGKSNDQLSQEVLNLLMYKFIKEQVGE